MLRRPDPHLATGQEKAYIPEMKKALSEVLGISGDRIGIKGKTTEYTKPFTVECHVVTLLESVL